MIGTVIARRYARAILELALESKTLPAVVQEFQSVADAYSQSSELQRVLANPETPAPARKAIVDEIAVRCGASQMTRNALAVLVDHRRTRLIVEVARALTREADKQAGVLRAEYRSAVALNEAYVQKLTSALEARFGKKIVATRTVDPTLLSGVVARVGDTVIDGSLRTRLDDLKRDLLS